MFGKTGTTVISESEKNQSTDDSQSAYPTTSSATMSTTRRLIPETNPWGGELDKSYVSHLFARIVICSVILFCLDGIDLQQDLHLEQIDIN